jgi:hypothetical protein
MALVSVVATASRAARRMPGPAFTLWLSPWDSVIRFGEPRDVSTHPLSEIVQAHLGVQGAGGGVVAGRVQGVGEEPEVPEFAGQVEGCPGAGV